MTDQLKARFQIWWPVVATVGPIFLGGFLAVQRMEARIQLLEARIAMHEQASSEVSAAVERRLGTIEGDIKLLLQRPTIK